MVNGHRMFVGLGSNLGDRLRNIGGAVERIRAARDTTLAALSPIYETAPVGVAEQPMFLNAVAEFRTGLTPREALRLFQEIEAALLRVRGERWGPRTIDLDLLLYDDLAITEEGLTVPHPRLRERAFVLQPLCDIAADVAHPTEGCTIGELWSRCGTGASSVSFSM